MLNDKDMNKNGFTLIEIIVASSIFAIVMMVAVTAVLSSVDANRRSQAMSILIGNLNLSIESMVRDIRTGKGYSECSDGVDACIQFRDKEGRTVKYYVLESEDGESYLNKDYPTLDVSSEGRVTAEGVEFDDVTFDILGTGDDDGPERVLFHLKATAGSGKARSSFNVQTLVTSRSMDISEVIERQTP